MSASTTIPAAQPAAVSAMASAVPASSSEPVYTTVSTKGQVVIPASIRHELGIEPGTRLAMRVEGGRMVMVPQKKLTWRDMRGITAGGPSMADELIEERRRDLERETEEGW